MIPVKVKIEGPENVNLISLLLGLINSHMSDENNIIHADKTSYNLCCDKSFTIDFPCGSGRKREHGLRKKNSGELIAKNCHIDDSVPNLTILTITYDEQPDRVKYVRLCRSDSAVFYSNYLYSKLAKLQDKKVYSHIRVIGTGECTMLLHAELLCILPLFGLHFDGKEMRPSMTKLSRIVVEPLYRLTSLQKLFYVEDLKADLLSELRNLGIFLDKYKNGHQIASVRDLWIVNYLSSI